MKISHLLEVFSRKFKALKSTESKTMTLLSKEMEGDVLICYLSIKEIPKINAIEIFNTVIIEGNSEQKYYAF
jgi:hypothetical protein